MAKVVLQSHELLPSLNAFEDKSNNALLHILSALKQVTSHELDRVYSHLNDVVILFDDAVSCPSLGHDDADCSRRESLLKIMIEIIPLDHFDDYLEHACFQLHESLRSHGKRHLISHQ